MYEMCCVSAWRDYAESEEKERKKRGEKWMHVCRQQGRKRRPGIDAHSIIERQL